MAAENGPGLLKKSQSRSLDDNNHDDDASKQARFPVPEHGLVAAQNETNGVAASTLDHSSPVHSSIEGSMSRLVIDDKKSYYVTNPLWASMAQEVWCSSLLIDVNVKNDNVETHGLAD